MPKLALMQHCITSLESFLQEALQNDFEMIVFSINFSSVHYESFELDSMYPDLALDSRQWSENVVMRLSDNIACDSKDIEIRKRSEYILRNEMNWSNHLQSEGIKLLQLKEANNFNLARIISNDLNGFLLIEVPLFNPFALHALYRADFNEHKNRNDICQKDTWQWWHDFHAASDYHSKIKVVLTLNENELPRGETIRRWLGEPVDAVILPTSLFKLKENNKIFLSEMWLKILKHFIRIKANIILSLSGEAENLLLYAKYLRDIFEETLAYHPHAGFEDILDLPQQPLKDNLSSSIYEQYEEDNAKYKLYQDAIAAALLDRVPESDRENIVTTIMVLGAGRGPLVRAALNASDKTGRKIYIYVIEKNINAIKTLRHIKEKLWANKDIKIIHTDMRDYMPPEKVDILISELLGSFGDNELSPECLNSAERFLKRNNGISIPCKYTSFIYPIMSTALYNQVRCLENCKFGPYGPGSLYNESGYVVLLQNVFNIGFPKPLFTFKHPNNDKDTERYEILKFESPMNCVLNGIAGCFEATLYKDIKISINPETHTPGLISWFSIYFPTKNPIPLKKSEIVEIHFWRCTSNTKVWYEWQIVSDGKITPVHNHGGYSYPIYSQ